MTTLKGIGAVVILAALVSGCASELEKAESTAPHGSVFNIRLYSGYLRLAQDEADRYDYSDSNDYARRAQAAAAGEMVEPVEVSARDLPDGMALGMTAVRERLMKVLDGGGRERAGADSAEAQVSFDCWMEELEENNDQDAIAACRSAFTGAIDRAEARLNPPPKKAMAAPAPKAAPMAAPKPMAMMEPAYFTVNFPTGGTGLNAAANATVRSAAAAYRAHGKAKVTVTGHSDTVGSGIQNLALSLRRGQAVQKVLEADGVPSSAIEVRARGETQLLVSTGDNVAEPRNRRVVIEIK